MRPVRCSSGPAIGSHKTSRAASRCRPGRCSACGDTDPPGRHVGTGRHLSVNLLRRALQGRGFAFCGGVTVAWYRSGIPVNSERNQAACPEASRLSGVEPFGYTDNLVGVLHEAVACSDSQPLHGKPAGQRPLFRG